MRRFLLYVAELTGVSKPMLGQIERGQPSPTINILWKISTGLKIQLSFFCRQQEAEYTVAELDTENLKSYMQCQWSLVGGMDGTFREME